MSSFSRILVFLFLCGLPALRAQQLVFSLANDIIQAPADLLEEEIQQLLPSGGCRAYLSLETLRLLFGDVDGDGRWDDGPTDIDAFHVAGSSLDQWFFSTTTSVALPGGINALDGDILAFTPAGQLVVAYPESVFASVTGTSGIDVDAFAIGAQGEWYFSFAEDETTTLPGLIAQNGGGATLDEQVVFRLDPGQSEAVIHLSQSAVAAAFSQALGGNYSSVVDVTGVAIDPMGNGQDLLLCAGSTSQALVGRVVSTRAGGTPFVINGAPVDPAALGLASPRLDALSLTPGNAHPVARAHPAEGSSSTGQPAVVVSRGHVPGTAVQLLATHAPLPGPFAWSVNGALGCGMAFVSPTDPMWSLSWSAPELLLMADAQGEVSYFFDYFNLPAGARIVIQSVTLPGGILSAPTSVSVLP